MGSEPFDLSYIGIVFGIGPSESGKGPSENWLPRFFVAGVRLLASPEGPHIILLQNQVSKPTISTVFMVYVKP